MGTEGTCKLVRQAMPREIGLSPQVVRDVLSLMHSYRIYNYNGQIAFKVSDTIFVALALSTI